LLFLFFALLIIRNLEGTTQGHIPAIKYSKVAQR